MVCFDCLIETSPHNGKKSLTTSFDDEGCPPFGVYRRSPDRAKTAPPPPDDPGGRRE